MAESSPHFKREEVLRQCSICTSNIIGACVKCLECRRRLTTLCIPCFQLGAEAGEHVRGHNYEVIDPIGPSICPPGIDGLLWSLSDDLLLYDFVREYKLGNWEELTKYFPDKRKAVTARSHFDQCFLNGPLWNHVKPTDEPHFLEPSHYEYAFSFDPTDETVQEIGQSFSVESGLTVEQIENIDEFGSHTACCPIPISLRMIELLNEPQKPAKKRGKSRKSRKIESESEEEDSPGVVDDEILTELRDIFPESMHLMKQRCPYSDHAGKVKDDDLNALGYMPHRDDFEVEHRNRSELLICGNNLFERAVCDPGRLFENEVKMIRMQRYRRDQKNREVAKGTAREFGLVSRFVSSLKSSSEPAPKTDDEELLQKLSCTMDQSLMNTMKDVLEMFTNQIDRVEKLQDMQDNGITVIKVSPPNKKSEIRVKLSVAESLTRTSGGRVFVTIDGGNLDGVEEEFEEAASTSSIAVQSGELMVRMATHSVIMRYRRLKLLKDGSDVFCLEFGHSRPSHMQAARVTEHSPSAVSSQPMMPICSNGSSTSSQQVAWRTTPSSQNTGPYTGIFGSQNGSALRSPARSHLPQPVSKCLPLTTKPNLNDGKEAKNHIVKNSQKEAKPSTSDGAKFIADNPFFPQAVGTMKPHVPKVIKQAGKVMQRIVKKPVELFKTKDIFKPSTSEAQTLAQKKLKEAELKKKRDAEKIDELFNSPSSSSSFRTPSDTRKSRDRRFSSPPERPAEGNSKRRNSTTDAPKLNAEAKTNDSPRVVPRDSSREKRNEKLEKPKVKKKTENGEVSKDAATGTKNSNGYSMCLKQEEKDATITRDSKESAIVISPNFSFSAPEFDLSPQDLSTLEELKRLENSVDTVNWNDECVSRNSSSSALLPELNIVENGTLQFPDDMYDEINEEDEYLTTPCSSPRIHSKTTSGSCASILSPHESSVETINSPEYLRSPPFSPFKTSEFSESPNEDHERIDSPEVLAASSPLSSITSESFVASPQRSIDETPLVFVSPVHSVCLGASPVSSAESSERLEIEEPEEDTETAVLVNTDELTKNEVPTAQDEVNLFFDSEIVLEDISPYVSPVRGSVCTDDLSLTNEFPELRDALAASSCSDSLMNEVLQESICQKSPSPLISFPQSPEKEEDKEEIHKVTSEEDEEANDKQSPITITISEAPQKSPENDHREPVLLEELSHSASVPNFVHTLSAEWKTPTVARSVDDILAEIGRCVDRAEGREDQRLAVVPQHLQVTQQVIVQNKIQVIQNIFVYNDKDGKSQRTITNDIESSTMYTEQTLYPSNGLPADFTHFQPEVVFKALPLPVQFEAIEPVMEEGEMLGEDENGNKTSTLEDLRPMLCAEVENQVVKPSPCLALVPYNPTPRFCTIRTGVKTARFTSTTTQKGRDAEFGIIESPIEDVIELKSFDCSPGLIGPIFKKPQKVLFDFDVFRPPLVSAITAIPEPVEKKKKKKKSKSKRDRAYPAKLRTLLPSDNQKIDDLMVWFDQDLEGAYDRSEMYGPNIYKPIYKRESHYAKVCKGIFNQILGNIAYEFLFDSTISMGCAPAVPVATFSREADLFYNMTEQMTFDMLAESEVEETCKWSLIVSNVMRFAKLTREWDVRCMKGAGIEKSVRLFEEVITVVAQRMEFFKMVRRHSERLFKNTVKLRRIAIQLCQELCSPAAPTGRLKASKSLPLVTKKREEFSKNHLLVDFEMFITHMDDKTDAIDSEVTRKGIKFRRNFVAALAYETLTNTLFGVVFVSNEGFKNYKVTMELLGALASSSVSSVDTALAVTEDLGAEIVSNLELHDVIRVQKRRVKALVVPNEKLLFLRELARGTKRSTIQPKGTQPCCSDSNASNPPSSAEHTSSDHTTNLASNTPKPLENEKDANGAADSENLPGKKENGSSDNSAEDELDSESERRAKRKSRPFVVTKSVTAIMVERMTAVRERNKTRKNDHVDVLQLFLKRTIMKQSYWYSQLFLKSYKSSRGLSKRLYEEILRELCSRVFVRACAENLFERIVEKAFERSIKMAIREDREKIVEEFFEELVEAEVDRVFAFHAMTEQTVTTSLEALEYEIIYQLWDTVFEREQLSNYIYRVSMKSLIRSVCVENLCEDQAPLLRAEVFRQREALLRKMPLPARYSSQRLYAQLCFPAICYQIANSYICGHRIRDRTLKGAVRQRVNSAYREQIAAESVNKWMKEIVAGPEVDAIIQEHNKKVIDALALRQSRVMCKLYTHLELEIAEEIAGRVLDDAIVEHVLRELRREKLEEMFQRLTKEEVEAFNRECADFVANITTKLCNRLADELVEEYAEKFAQNVLSEAVATMEPLADLATAVELGCQITEEEPTPSQSLDVAKKRVNIFWQSDRFTAQQREQKRHALILAARMQIQRCWDALHQQFAKKKKATPPTDGFDAIVTKAIYQIHNTIKRDYKVAILSEEIPPPIMENACLKLIEELAARCKNERPTTNELYSFFGREELNNFWLKTWDRMTADEKEFARLVKRLKGEDIAEEEEVVEEEKPVAPLVQEDADEEVVRRMPMPSNGRLSLVGRHSDLAAHRRTKPISSGNASSAGRNAQRARRIPSKGRKGTAAEKRRVLKWNGAGCDVRLEDFHVNEKGSADSGLDVPFARAKKGKEEKEEEKIEQEDAVVVTYRAKTAYTTEIASDSSDEGSAREHVVLPLPAETEIVAESTKNVPPEPTPARTRRKATSISEKKRSSKSKRKKRKAHLMIPDDPSPSPSPEF